MRQIKHLVIALAFCLTQIIWPAAENDMDTADDLVTMDTTDDGLTKPVFGTLNINRQNFTIDVLMRNGSYKTFTIGDLIHGNSAWFKEQDIYTQIKYDQYLNDVEVFFHAPVEVSLQDELIPDSEVKGGKKRSGKKIKQVEHGLKVSIPVNVYDRNKAFADAVLGPKEPTDNVLSRTTRLFALLHVHNHVSD